MTSIAPRAWDTYSACAAVEGFDEQDHDQDEIISAWQHLIDTGHAFRLQGWCGRMTRDLIRAGLCNPRPS
jgi:hypothetical protein